MPHAISLGVALALAVAALAGAGCAPRFRAELVARSAMDVAPAPDAPGARLPVAAPGRFELSYVLVLPRALELQYRVICPGTETSGTVGERWESYRARRLAELERQRQRNAALVGGLVGSALPDVAVQGAAQTPGVAAEGSAEVRPGDAAAAATYEAQGAPELPPGDTGARVLHGRLALDAASAGECTVAIWSQVPGEDARGVHVELTFEKLVDVRAEAQAQRAAERARHEEAARATRGTVTGRLAARGATPRDRQAQWRAQVDVRTFVIGGLVARGADPHRLAREQAARAEQRSRDAEVRRQRDEARRQQRARLEWQRQEARRLRWEAEWRLAHEGLRLRRRVLDRCLGAGADPTLRQRQEEAELAAWHEQQRARAAARAQAEAEARLEYEASLRVRGALKLRLAARGAVDRPPMPLAQVEAPPPAPWAGASWVGGTWTWDGAAWVWIAGRWERPPERGTVWVGPVRVDVGGTVVVKPGRWIRVKIGK